MIRVSFACNDPDNGVFTGRAEMATVHGDGVDIELERPNMQGAAFVWLDEPPVTKQMLLKGFTAKMLWPRCDRGFRLSGHSFGCYGYKYGYGNWCWDATRMAAVDVLSLLRFMRERGWCCREAASSFYDAFESGAELTPALLTDALSAEELERAV